MKKVLQKVKGKILILASLFCAIAFTGNAQHVTMQTSATVACTISANEVRATITFTNDGAQDIRWNGAVVRVVWPAGMFNTVPALASQTFSNTYEGGSDFPLSFANGVGAAAAGAAWTPATRTLTWCSTPNTAYTGGCPGGTAPTILIGQTATIGTFSFKRTDNVSTTGFVAGQSATFTFAATAAIICYKTSPCAATTTTLNTLTTTRDFGTICSQTVPASCAVTGSGVGTAPTCFGGTNGSAVITLAGTGSSGTSYQYTVDGGGTQTAATNGFTINGLTAGVHNITATVLPGGCVATPFTVTVGATPALTGSTGSTTAATTCTPGNEGSTVVTLSASTSGTYTVDGGSTQNYNSNPFTVSGLTAGNHSIVATSGAGCESNSMPVTVGGPAALTGSATATSVTCFGSTDGTMTVTLSSAASGTYTVDGGPSTPYAASPFVISGLGAGGHNVIATSAGCTSGTITATVGNVAQLSGSATTAPVTCFGSTNGSITVTLTASSSGTYSLDGGPGQPYATNPFTISNVGAGPHSVVATSTAGCVSTAIPATVGGPAALTGSATTTPASCTGNDGTMQVTLTASTSGTYSLDGGSAQNYNSNPFTISGLAAGGHTVTATSAAGCVSNLISASVGSSSGLSGTATGSDVTCVGGPNSGSATVTLTGTTTAPGTYTLNGGPATPYATNPFTITGLAVGTYSIVVTSGGCTTSAIPVSIGAPVTFTATYVKTNISACNATNDGTITVTPAGGVGPYTYAWSGGYPGFAPGNVNAVSNLPIGYYNVTVTDAGGCGSVVITNIHIEYAFTVYVTNSGTSSSACANTGSISLYGNSGVAPYTYSITSASGPWQASNTFTGLGAGTYTGYIKDAAGCVGSKSNIQVTAAAAIVVNPFVTNASSCNADGSIQVFRTGGTPPYTYSVVPGTNSPAGTYQTNNYFGSLASGPYTCWVKDAAGCTSSANATVNAGVGVSITTSKVNTSSCQNDGSIQVTATGGVAPYTYSKSGVGGPYQASNSFPGLGSGNYAIVAKDSKGCLSNPSNVTININTITATASVQNATTCVSNNGKVQLFVTGGTGPYTYSLDGNTYQTGQLFTNVAPGSYTGFIKDSKTCIGTVPVTVGPNCPPPPVALNTKGATLRVMPTELKIQAYPNPSVDQFTLVLSGYDATAKVTITVTDVMGKKVFQTEGTGKLQYMFGKGLFAGIYNVQVVQGNDKKSLKLVKE